MLVGDLTVLRARRDGDVAPLQTGLHDDALARVRADTRGWRPVPPGSAMSPYAPTDPSPDVARFTVVERHDDDPVAAAAGAVVAGEALLWNIDTHNRSGHLGLALLPTHRGRGLGADVVEVLCRFGFDLLGLHRLQIDTLSTNTAMRRVAERSGFVHEGTRRDAAWVDGQFVDDVIYGSTAARRGGERAR